ncbi:cohesin subunit SA-1 [Exaiptasia diaphana]|uniref:SCD domain-containing protein n=1 Tax=Exaiptasia diaphana TaxID=2652724 RepID=A0A913YTU2_EXADI|nr:cohesin subunit SA-1 [Exaiptasia diaphana]
MSYFIYRDSRPEIRALCISEIGEWMKEYSTLFLNDRYLKYIVWNLHDKIGEVRLRSIQALLGLYEDEDLVPHLDALTSRFKDRFVSMTLDKDNEVAVEAVKLTGYQYQYEKLDEEDCQQIQLLVFCTHRQVAHAAGQFLYKRIKDAADEQISSRSKKGDLVAKKSDKETKVTQIKKLLEFFINSEVHHHGAYLVDSLWSTMPVIKDWKLMTDMLLEDKTDESGLDDKEEAALIEILVSSCKQASLGQSPPGRATKKTVSSKEKKAINNDKKELSAHFMQTLPDLLAKYGTDSDKVLSLVSVPQCFDLEEYGQRRLGKYLDELLNQLSGVVEKFTDSEILQECAKTYRMLTDNEYTLSTTAEVARNKLVDQFVESFKKSLNKGLDADDDEDSEERFALISSLEKVCAFYKAHDLGKWKLYESLHQIMDRATSDQDTVSDKILNLTLYSMQCLLLWALSGLDPSHPDKSQLKKLKKWISTFIKQCEELVGYSNIEVRTEAFLCMCDLLVVFAKQITNQSALFAPLIYEANVSFQATCRDFIVNHIFANITEDSEEEDEDEDQTDEKVEELSKKRTLLAGFCKLIIYNIFDMGLVAPIFSFLNKAFGDFGDIIKHTMNKCKEINKTTYAKTLLTSLQQEFVCLKDDFQGEVDVKSEDFGLIRDLAHRFALSLGVDTTKSHAREALIKLHREGIHYSLKINKRNSPRKGSGGVPPNLTFLDILNEFTFRLIHQDKVGKNGVLQYLEKEAGEMLKMKGNDWAPLINYRGNLLGNQEGEDNAESPKQDKSKGQRGRPRKSPTQQLPNTGHKHELTSLDCDEDSAEDETPLKRVKKAHISEQIPQEKEMEEFQEEGNSSLQQKRKRMDSELDEESEDFDSIGMPSSQRSWLSSQKKASKRPKLSYSKKGRTSLEDEKEETEIKEFVSDEDADATEKPPIKVRRERHKLPEILFDDSENSKNMEDDLDQPAI